MTAAAQIEKFISDWAVTGGSELANTQSFVNGLASLIGVDPPKGSQPDDAQNDYVFERRVFQDNGDGTTSFGRLDAYKRDCFVLEAKQGTDADREAAKRGESDFFGKPAAEKIKQGTAKRGTPGWAAAMLKAKGQAERYAKALPLEHGWPPFLLITDVGHCIDVYADFSGTGKQYTQFPDAARFRIKLDDLRDEKVRERLALIWTNPLSLDPSKEAAKVTREIAGHLADLSKRLELRGNNATRVADFLMRCLFTMFAEDVGLIPESSFTTLLKKMATRPENLTPALTDLWAKMDTGGFVGALGDAGETVRKFNGYLFKDQSVIPLQVEEIALLIAAAEKKWNHVEPAIFGTLLERALDGKERAKLGAHYTPRAYVERLVMPTVIEPLRADWAGVQAAAASLIEAGKAKEARAVVEKFHGALAQTKVLDPACGTGNFLYVAMARMKELEGEVVSLLTELGYNQYVAELSGHTITPENFLGIEINPRAAAIAQLVLWIGYLQWHFRVNGEGRMPPEPVLRDVKTIENRDALITWDKKVMEKDEHGKPLTRWDGETMKLHLVTGEEVPDEAAQMEIYRYVNPKPTKWPKADFIVGNPPFIGLRNLRKRLDDFYIQAVRSSYPSVPDNVDWVMYWWFKAAQLTQIGKVAAFGLVTTKSLTQSFARRLTRPFLTGKQKLSYIFAIPNHPWIDDVDGADVRISIVAMRKGHHTGLLNRVSNERDSEEGYVDVELSNEMGMINARLDVGNDVTDCQILKSNSGLCSVGYQIGHSYLYLDDDTFKNSIYDNERSILFENQSASHITGRRPKRYVIDASDKTESEFRSAFPNLYQFVSVRWTGARERTVADSSDRTWWSFQRPRDDFRKASRDLSSIIVRPLTSKHEIFVMREREICCDSTCVLFAFSDNYWLGILQCRVHDIWFAENQGNLGIGNDPRYLKSDCFDPFPFPADVPEALKDRIRTEAEALDSLRKKVLADHADLTLTGLYNVLEALRANDGKGRALTEKERDLHDRGLVTLIRQHHDAIDTLVAEAYGWPTDLSDEDILTRLVALNRTRADEEAKGIIRWLRPEFQAPGTQAIATNRDLDLGDTPTAPATATIIPWPKTLAEQVSAVAAVLAASPAPQHARDIARAFDGKRAATITPVLDALTAIGQARRLGDGRYAA